MKYRIGKIADLLHVSIETVRNYEKLGLITPERDKENGYRLYNAIDLNVLRRARAYTSYGLSVRESADLVLNGNLEDLAAVLERHAGNLREQLRRDTLLLRFVEQGKHHLNRIAPCMGESSIENSPPMYVMTYRKGLEISNDPATQALLHEWNMLRPFTQAAAVYDREHFRRNNARYSHGLCIEQPYADFFGIKETELVRFFPSRKCLYTFLAGTYEPNIAESSVYANPIIDKLEEKGYTVIGEPLCRVLHTGKVNGEFKHFIETWVPIA